MPMIDIYATAGRFRDPAKLAADAAAIVKDVEQVPDIPTFSKNTAAFVHELAAGAIGNVDGDSDYVRVQVLTNAGALNRDKQIAVVRRLTDLVAAAAGDPRAHQPHLGAADRGGRGRLGSLGSCPHQPRDRRRRARGDRQAQGRLIPALSAGEVADLASRFL